MITEYYVLDILSTNGWQTADEVSPSADYHDLWTIRRMLEVLEHEELVEHVRSQENIYSYNITQSGQYRLQQLRERQEYESQTTALLGELNAKLDCEKNERIRESEKNALEIQKQKRIDRIRFWATFIATLIGSIAAVGGLIATIALS